MVMSSLLNLLASSKMRRNILLFLEDGPRTLSEIKDHLDVGSPQLSSKMKELLEYDVIRSDRKTFSLTPQGRVILEKYTPFANTAEVFGKLSDYWRTHELDRVPEELMYRIGEICTAKCIENDVSDMNRLKNFRDQLMKNANWILSASPIFDEETSYLVFDLAARGVPVTIVTSNDVINRVSTEYVTDVQNILSIKAFSLYSSKTDIGTPFILTDKCLYFTIYYRDGKTDLQMALVSDDPAAIQWGKDLFTYYEKRAVKVTG